MKKILIFGFLVLMLFISACAGPLSGSYKDCGSDKECVVASLLKGEKAKANIIETEQQGDFTTTVSALIRSEGEKDGKVLVYQEILDMNVQMPEVPPLPEGSSESERQQYELSKNVLKSFAGNFEQLEGTNLNCALDPAKVEVLGIDDAVNEAMQASLDPVTLKAAPNASCSGTMLDAFANIMSQMIQMLTQALSQAAIAPVER